MEVLANMTDDQMIIILPAGLIAMVLVLNLQKWLCNRPDKRMGLILPILCLIVATVLAVKPMIALSGQGYDGVIVYGLRLWFTFNIPTIVFVFQYWKLAKDRRLQAENSAPANGDETSGEDGSSSVK